jgi:hypothetical protein
MYIMMHKQTSTCNLIHILHPVHSVHLGTTVTVTNDQKDVRDSGYTQCMR